MSVFLPLRAVMLFLVMLLLVSASSPAMAAVPRLNWNQLDQTLEGVSIESNFLVAEFRGSSCATIHERDADRTLAIASTFKLYVLGALSLQILDGTASWDDRITLTQVCAACLPAITHGLPLERK